MRIQQFADFRTPEMRKAYQTIEQQRADAQAHQWFKPTAGILDVMSAIRQRWPDRVIQRSAIRRMIKRLRELRGE
jgi:hypothetical protein